MHIKHLIHYDDLLIADPNKFFTIEKEMMEDLKAGKPDKFSEKIDGAPAFVFGNDGRPFVATKSFFNKGGSERFYEESHILSKVWPQDLRMKMFKLLFFVKRHFKDQTQHHYMGDFLFIEQTPKNGELTFRPNILKYEYTPYEDTNFYYAMGICIHTLVNPSGSLDRITLKDHQLRSLVDDEEVFVLFPELRQLEPLSLSFIPHEMYRVTGDLPKEIISAPTKNGIFDFGRFTDYLVNKYITEAEKRKTMTGYSNQIEKGMHIHQDFVHCLWFNPVYFQQLQSTQKQKHEIIDHLDRFSIFGEGDISVELKAPHGYTIDAETEGWVYWSSIGPVKLVRKHGFSALNKDPDLVRGFELEV